MITKKEKMKIRIFLIFFIGLTFIKPSFGQSIQNKIADKTCDCLNENILLENLNDSIKACTTKAMSEFMTTAPLEERKFIGTVQGIRGMYSDVYKILPSKCYKIRKIVIEDKKKRFYTISDNSNANSHFYKGNELMENEVYKQAIKEFKKAIKIDPNFVYSIDHIAISYRKMEKFEKAINFYNKSLEIFPEGDVALMNMGVIYTHLENFEKAIQYYDKLVFYHQNNPEGYFGRAKILFLVKNYEVALDNIFIAHRIYSSNNSDYANDTSTIIKMIHEELKNNNQLDVFKMKAEEYNINLE